MMEPSEQKYQWGQRVIASTDLFNDGTYPEFQPEELLVRTGEAGEVLNIGRHVDSNTTVYLVEFQERRVVGCLEHEISAV